MPKAISFDFWNTLYADGAENERKVRRKKYFARLIEKHREFQPVEIDRAFDAGSELFLSQWINKFRTPPADERIGYMAEQLDVRLTTAEINAAVDYFGKMIFEIPPQNIEHLKELVIRLAANYPLGIISDTGFISGRYIRDFLESEMILSCFSSFVFSDENKHSKPHVSVFEKTAGTLKVSLSELMHIGDLERTDIAGAINAGCVSVKYTGVNQDSAPQSGAHHVIKDYRELFDIIPI